MPTAPDTITIKLDPEAMAVLTRLAEALEALIKQQQIVAPAKDTPQIGPFFSTED